MSLRTIVALAAFSFNACAHAALPEPALAPERAAGAHDLVSDHDPAIRIRLPQEAVYVGATRWLLHDASDAEMHVFVEADETGLVERHYWIQFEAYVPSRPELAFDYPESNPEKTMLGNYSVHVRPGFSGGPDGQSRPGSDSEVFRALLAEHGYRLPMWMAQVRFVHLPTADRRKEVMIIYGENLDDVGLNMAEAMMRGKEGISWDELYIPLIERARRRIGLEPFGAE